MSIDWFTFLAQLVNFAILVFLLRRFLYRPIVAGLAARQQKIDAAFAEAQQMQQAAAAAHEKFLDEQAQFERTREQLRTQVQEEVQKERHRLLEGAQAEMAEKRRRWQDAWQQEQVRLRQLLVHKIHQQSFTLAKKVLSDMAGTGIEAQMLQCLIEKLEFLPDEERQRFLAGSEPLLRVESSFPLNSSQQQRLLAKVESLVGRSLEIEATSSDEIAWGLRLSLGSRAIAWTVEQYLAQLEIDIEDLLSEVSALEQTRAA